MDKEREVNSKYLETCQSGLMSIFAKDVSPLKAPRVRIPPFPQKGNGRHIAPFPKRFPGFNAQSFVGELRVQTDDFQNETLFMSSASLERIHGSTAEGDEILQGFEPRVAVCHLADALVELHLLLLKLLTLVEVVFVAHQVTKP